LCDWETASSFQGSISRRALQERKGLASRLVACNSHFESESDASRRVGIRPPKRFGGLAAPSFYLASTAPCSTFDEPSGHPPCEQTTPHARSHPHASGWLREHRVQLFVLRHHFLVPSSSSRSAADRAGTARCRLRPTAQRPDGSTSFGSLNTQRRCRSVPHRLEACEGDLLRHLRVRA
jgi:hypothetical protein